MTSARSRRKARRRVPSGAYSLAARLRAGGLASIEGEAGAELQRQRELLLGHLGGTASETQRLLVEDVVALGAIISTAFAALGAWGVLDRRKRCLRRLAADVAKMVGQRAALLRDLGWKAQTREIPMDDEVAALLAGGEQEDRQA